MLCDVFSADQDHGGMLTQIPVLGTNFSIWELLTSIAVRKLADPDDDPCLSGKSVSAPEVSHRINSVQPTQLGRKIEQFIRLARTG
mgnify:FL=1